MATPPALDAPPARACAYTARLAFELIDGSLAPSAVIALEAHLAACPSCHARVEHDRRFLTAIRRRRLRVAAPESLRAQARALAAAFAAGRPPASR